MKVTLLSYEDGGGGAGRAALRLHSAMREDGVDCVLRVVSWDVILRSWRVMCCGIISGAAVEPEKYP